MVPHLLFWAVATVLFLVYGQVGTARRFPVSFAVGLTCLAAFFSARVFSSDGRRRRLAHAAYIAIAFVVLGVLSLHGTYAWSVGRLHTQAIEAILQTDFAEAFGYIATRLLFLWAVLWVLSGALLWLTFPKASDRVTSTGWAQALLLTAGLVFLTIGRPVVTEPLEVVDSYRDGTEALRRSVHEWKSRPHTPIETDFSGTVVVVIGESTTRHHMSLYGYPRRRRPGFPRCGRSWRCSAT